jgi:hypothetical protein
MTADTSADKLQSEIIELEQSIADAQAENPVQEGVVASLRRELFGLQDRLNALLQPVLAEADDTPDADEPENVVYLPSRPGPTFREEADLELSARLANMEDTEA